MRDFAPPADPIFIRATATTHWKPIMFLNNDLCPLMPYMLMRRTTDGHWYIQIKAFGPKPIREQYETIVSIAKCVQNEGNQPEQFHPKFTYRGLASSSNDSRPTSENNEEYLCLKDEQIKPLTRNSDLFRIKVEFVRNNNRQEPGNTEGESITSIVDQAMDTNNPQQTT